MLKASIIKKTALSLGFNLCGIAPYALCEEDAVYLHRWLGCGFNAHLSYMNRYEDIRRDPKLLLSGVKSVIVLGVNYKNHDTFFQTLDFPNKIASYAVAVDYHTTLRSMMGELKALLEQCDSELNFRMCVDSAPIFEKAWAVKAGLGSVGRNSLVINPQFGSTILLCELLIDTEVDSYDEVIEFSPCDGCELCIKACPRGAILPDKTIDAARCVSALTTHGSQSENCVSGWVFGCDICQRVCPHNADTPECCDERFLPIIHRSDLSQEFWHSATKSDFKRIFGRSAVGGIKFELFSKRILKKNY